MRRWTPLLLLALFAYDVGIDSFEADCLGSAEETCCACLCQTHAVSPAATQPMTAPTASSGCSLAHGTLFLAHLSDKSLFHPPKTAV